MAAVGIVSIGSKAVIGSSVFKIASALITSPIAGTLIAMGIYLLIIKLIKNKPDPYIEALKFLPIFGFANTVIIFYAVFNNGFKIE